MQRVLVCSNYIFCFMFGQLSEGEVALALVEGHNRGASYCPSAIATVVNGAEPGKQGSRIQAIPQDYLNTGY